MPVYFANMAPVLIKFQYLNKPVSKKLFGENKTWNGIVVAIITGTLIFYLQKIMYQWFANVSIINYSNTTILLGFALSTGAILGDLFESFIKRKKKIPPGDNYFPYDQTDYIFGALLFGSYIHVLQIEYVVTALVSSLVLHPTINYLGYLLKIKENKL